jgi:iron(III) transport system ATP-binding protein
MGLVFQSYALWPHLTIERNVDFGLRLRKVAEGRARGARRQGDEGARHREIPRRYPSQLSGGQQQRVALARMLAVNPACCCSTNRCPTWTRRCGWKCGPN